MNTAMIALAIGVIFSNIVLYRLINRLSRLQERVRKLERPKKG